MAVPLSTSYLGLGVHGDFLLCVGVHCRGGACVSVAMEGGGAEKVTIFNKMVEKDSNTLTFEPKIWKVHFLLEKRHST